MSTKLKVYPDVRETGAEWIDRIPSHWRTARIKNLFRESDTRRGEAKYPLLSLTRLRGLILHADATNKLASAEDLAKYKVCLAGNLVMNRMQAWSGMFAAAQLDGIVSPDYSVFIPTSTANVEFFESLFKTPIYIGQFASASKGIGSGFNRLYSPEFGGFPVFIPPQEEQNAIVRFIRHTDRRVNWLIKTKHRLIKLLFEQKQAIIHNTITRGLDPDVRFKPSGIEWLDDVPESWQVVPLRHLVDVQTGITLGKNYYGQAVETFPYLRVANVQNGYFDLSHVKTIEIPASEARCRLFAGDVLVTEGGDPDKLGRGSVWDGQIDGCLHQNHIFCLRPLQAKLRPQFLAYLLSARYGRTYFTLTSKQTTNLASTNSSILKAFPIMLPNLDEQDAIINQLHDSMRRADIVIDRTHREIDLIREYRTRLIADVVTGKIDVRDVKLPDLDALAELEIEDVEMDEIVDELDEGKELEDAND